MNRRLEELKGEIDRKGMSSTQLMGIKENSTTYTRVHETLLWKFL